MKLIKFYLLHPCTGVKSIHCPKISYNILLLVSRAKMFVFFFHYLYNDALSIVVIVSSTTAYTDFMSIVVNVPAFQC